MRFGEEFGCEGGGLWWSWFEASQVQQEPPSEEPTREGGL